MSSIRTDRPVVSSPSTTPAQKAPTATPTAPASPAAPGWSSQGATARPAVQERAPVEISQVVADAQALYGAFHGGKYAGLGTDEGKVFQVLSGRSPQHLAEVKRVYQEHFHKSLDGDLGDELSGRELTRARALLAGDGVQGQVEALRTATGTFGANQAELLSILESTPPQAMKAVAERFGQQFGPLDKAISHSLTGPARDEALALLHGDVAGANAAHLDGAINLHARPAEVVARLQQLSPDAMASVAKAFEARTGKPLTTQLQAKLKGTERDMAVALATGDALGLKAAKLKHAVEGKFLGLGKDATGALAVLETASPQERAALQKQYQAKYGATIEADVVQRFGGREGDRLQKALAGTLDDVERIQIALKGFGADEKALDSVLGGRSKEDVAKLKADFLSRTGQSLDTTVQKELSGRARFDAQQALLGAPTTPEEQLARAQARHDFERSGAANSVARYVLDKVSDSGKRLDESTALAQQALATAKRDGHVDGAEQARLAELVARSGGEAKTYVEQKGTAAQLAGTAAAAAVTVATAGAGAPLLVTAAAGGAATVAGRAAMQGKGYAKDDAVRDAASGTLASLAGSAGNAVVGKAATSVTGRVMQEGVSGAVTGFIQGGADTALRDETWNSGLAEGLASTGLDATKQALQSGASSAARGFAGELNPWKKNVVATKFPGEKEPVDLSTVKADTTTRKTAKAMLEEQGTYATHESMVKWTKKNTPELAKVHTEDLIGLREYTANGYVKMNEGLRGKRTSLKEMAPVVKTAASGLKGMPEVKGTVYRGANMPPERLANYKPGTVISERGFTSTTQNKAMVLGQTAEQSFNKNTMFVIKSKGGGRDVSMLSQFPDEREVLFAPGTEFKVLKNAFDKKLKKNVIYLEEVPS